MQNGFPSAGCGQWQDRKHEGNTILRSSISRKLAPANQIFTHGGLGGVMALCCMTRGDGWFKYSYLLAFMAEMERLN